MILAVAASKTPQAQRLLDRIGEPHFQIGRVIALPRGAKTRVIYA